MKNRWSDKKATAFIEKYAPKWDKDLALRIYSSRLIGSEEELVLHGGGNTSVKGIYVDVLNRQVPAIYVKASGHDLENIEPEGYTALDLDYLKELEELTELSVDSMINELLTRRFDARTSMPSIESLMHAFLPARFIDHTHADAILALTNRKGGNETVKEVLGDAVRIINYVKPGFDLARAVIQTYRAFPESIGIVLLKHGLITWGETAKESYDATVELVSRAEKYLNWNKPIHIPPDTNTSLEIAKTRYLKTAPVLRGLSAIRSENPDHPYLRFILKPLITSEILQFLDSENSKKILLTPPLTSDHIIRIKPLPLWIGEPQFDDPEILRNQLKNAISTYNKEYDAYFNRFSNKLGAGIHRIDPMPRIIIIPGVGIICTGKDETAASIARDIARHTIKVKSIITQSSAYEGISEAELFDMEYFVMQQAKLKSGSDKKLQGKVALITGSAGAIGAGISEALLEEGCHVAISDLAGEKLDTLTGDLKEKYGNRIIGIPVDVTDKDSVSKGFQKVIEEWGGLDIIIVNAGIAYVSTLENMDFDKFHQLEKVNIEGTLLVLSEAGRHFKTQNSGGDIILISTKNVFSPSASFGAYSATKAASHQLARIASLEFAGMDVRVNMVSPDGVFSHGKYKSGLWAEVGPDRMRARNLDEKGLEEYYQNRNMLKSRITASHVASAVMYFATRQSPTTGATIPVDGGLPDATPR